MVLLKWVLEHLGEVPIGKRLHGVLQSLMAERDRRKYATLSMQTIARSFPVRTEYIFTWGLEGCIHWCCAAIRGFVQG